MPLVAGLLAGLTAVASGLSIVLAPIAQALLTFLTLVWTVVTKYQEWISTHFPASDKTSISKLIIVLFIVLCIIAWAFGGV